MKKLSETRRRQIAAAWRKIAEWLEQTSTYDEGLCWAAVRSKLNTHGIAKGPWGAADRAVNGPTLPRAVQNSIALFKPRGYSAGWYWAHGSEGACLDASAALAGRNKRCIAAGLLAAMAEAGDLDHFYLTDINLESA